jgi:hypothetical protein
MGKRTEFCEKRTKTKRVKSVDDRQERKSTLVETIT